MSRNAKQNLNNSQLSSNINSNASSPGLNAISNRNGNGHFVSNSMTNNNPNIKYNAEYTNGPSSNTISTTLENNRGNKNAANALNGNNGSIKASNSKNASMTNNAQSNLTSPEDLNNDGSNRNMDFNSYEASTQANKERVVDVLMDNIKAVLKYELKKDRARFHSLQSIMEKVVRYNFYFYAVYAHNVLSQDPQLLKQIQALVATYLDWKGPKDIRNKILGFDTLKVIADDMVLSKLHSHLSRQTVKLNVNNSDNTAAMKSYNNLQHQLADMKL